MLILDWDVHHGNGTQQLFYDSEEVMFISIHKYNHARFYPCSPMADYKWSGKKGRNVNIPLDNCQDSIEIGDSDYIYIYESIVEPLIRAYRPDCILVSNGLDALVGDPLGKL